MEGHGEQRDLAYAYVQKLEARANELEQRSELLTVQIQVLVLEARVQELEQQGKVKDLEIAALLRSAQALPLLLPSEAVLPPPVETPATTASPALATNEDDEEEGDGVEEEVVPGKPLTANQKKQQKKKAKKKANKLAMAAVTATVVTEGGEEAISPPIATAILVAEKVEEQSVQVMEDKEEVTVAQQVVIGEEQKEEAVTTSASPAEEVVAVEEEEVAAVQEEEKVVVQEEQVPVPAEDEDDVVVAFVEEILAIAVVEEEILATPIMEKEEEILPATIMEKEKADPAIVEEQTVVVKEATPIVVKEEDEEKANTPPVLSTPVSSKWGDQEEEEPQSAPVSIGKGESIPFSLMEPVVATAMDSNNINESKNHKKPTRKAVIKTAPPTVAPITVVTPPLTAAPPVPIARKLGKPSSSRISQATITSTTIAKVPQVLPSQTLQVPQQLPTSKEEEVSEQTTTKSVKIMTTPTKSTTATVSSSKFAASPFDTLKKPPPGFAALPPLKGVMVVLESGISSETGFGYAVLNVSVSRRNQYLIQDVTSGKVLLEFEREGTDFPRCRLDNLPCGFIYSLQVFEAKGKKRALPEATASLEISQVPPPLPPTAVTVVDRQRTTVKIKFVPPASDGGFAITQHEYELKQNKTLVPQGQEEGSSVVPVVGKLECALKNLLPGTKYSIRIRARNELGVGKFSSVLHFTTSEAPPSAPQIAKELVSELGNELAFRIVPPERDNGSQVTAYEVHIKPASSTDFVVCFNSELDASGVVSVANLHEHTVYVFRVRAQNQQGQSPWSDLVEFATTAALPAPMRQPTVLILPQTGELVVNWDAKPGCTFSLEAKREGNATKWIELYSGPNAEYRSATTDGGGVFPGVRYSFRVSALNARGRGGESPSSDVVKLPSVAPLPPAQPPTILACNVHQRTMRIQFGASENNGGSTQTGSVVEIRRVKPLTKKDLMVATVVSPKPALQVFASEAEYLATVKPQKQVSKYTVGELVDAVYGEEGKYYRGRISQVQGEGENVEYHVSFLGYDNTERMGEQHIRAAFVPGQHVLASLYETTAGAATVETNLVLPAQIVSLVNEGYWIAFQGKALGRQQTHAFDVVATEPKHSPVVPVSVPTIIAAPVPRVLSLQEWCEVCETSEFEHTITGLQPGADYEVRIAAVSMDAGKGEFGTKFPLKMAASVPLPPTAAPEQLPMAKNNRVAFRLANTAGDQGSPITGCLLQWACCQVKPESGAIVLVSALFSQQVLPQEMDNVLFTPNRELGQLNFVLRHRLRNKLGNGEFSNWTLLTNIPILAPSAVQDLKLAVSPATNKKPCSSVLVSFSAPEKTNGSVITAYRVQYRKIPELVWMDKVVDTLSMKLEQLDCGATYEVRVQALNSAGAGQHSSVEFIRLPGTVPTSTCTNVKINVKSHREFEATWDFDLDLHSGGEAISYEIEYVLQTGSKLPPPAKLQSTRGEVATANSKSFTRNSKTTLRPNTSYWFRVGPFNKIGQGTFTEWQAFTIPSAPIIAVTTTAPVAMATTAMVCTEAQDVNIRACRFVGDNFHVEVEIEFTGGNGEANVHMVEITDSITGKKRVFTNVKLSSSIGNRHMVMVSCHHHVRPKLSYSVRLQLVHAFSKPISFTAPELVVLPTVKIPVPVMIRKSKTNNPSYYRVMGSKYYGFAMLLVAVAVCLLLGEYLFGLSGGMGLVALAAVHHYRVPFPHKSTKNSSAHGLCTLPHFANKTNGLAAYGAVWLCALLASQVLWFGLLFATLAIATVSWGIYYIYP
ncbi:hypothetical protein BASA81_005518 [Batrachochytrium salamandrivorans]|nr:hypothetical protein BASA81_005518 [Batrachochytrium salamandrivorans]